MRLETPPFFEERLALTFTLVLSLFSMCFMLHPQSAFASTKVTGPCGSNHCYGTNTWPGHMYGASTNVGVRGMGGGDGFTLNGLWVIDTNPNQVEDCRVLNNSKRGYCWIEVEYKAFGVGQYAGTTRWDWADLRPNYRYFEHPDSNVLGSNDYGHFAYAVITQLDATDWFVGISGNQTTYTGKSTGNTMYPDAIKIGIELSGSQGWSVSYAHFIYNQWRGSNSWSYQMIKGNKDPSTPPAEGDWESPPNGNNQGGDWFTCVLGAGC